MTVEHLAGTVYAQHHERGGIGIGYGTGLGKYRGRQEAVLHRVAGAGVDGVGILAPTFIVEVTVVATGGHRDVRQADDGLQLVVDRQRVVLWLRHTDAPWLALGVMSADHHLATYLNHEVAYAFLLQQAGHHIRAIALGDGAEVHL